MNRRQVFLSHKQYYQLSEHLEGTEAFWQEHSMEADCPLQEASLKARQVQQARLHRLILGYTAGEPMQALAQALDAVVESYEDYQRKLARYEELPEIAPLAIDHYPHDFEEHVQVISLCILLQRSDLLPRVALLQDRAGYHGEDVLIEDLLKGFLADRVEVDEWYHEVYTPLVRAVYHEDPAQARELLVEYCNQWYPAFVHAPWHDSHSFDDDGGYFGYWAFEAAAIVYLYGLDDSAVRHMIYPRDMLQYARRFTPPNIPGQAAQD